MARLKLTAWGSEHEITLRINTYLENGNLAIEMFCWDEGFPEPWSVLTVNLIDEEKCLPNCAYIDTNNNGENIVDWLEANKLGIRTGNLGVSGWCVYPEFKFNMEEVQKYVK